MSVDLNNSSLQKLVVSRKNNYDSNFVEGGIYFLLIVENTDSYTDRLMYLYKDNMERYEYRYAASEDGNNQFINDFTILFNTAPKKQDGGGVENAHLKNESLKKEHLKYKNLKNNFE